MVEWVYTKHSKSRSESFNFNIRYVTSRSFRKILEVKYLADLKIEWK